MTISFAEAIMPLKFQAEKILEELVRGLEFGQRIKLHTSGRDYNMPFFVVPLPDKVSDVEAYLLSQEIKYERIKQQHGIVFEDFRVESLTIKQLDDLRKRPEIYCILPVQGLPWNLMTKVA